MENGSSDILRQVRKIEIKTRGLSNDIFAGHYRSAFKGRGMAFSEVREYRAGDDVRDIDWNVTARSRNPHIKVYAATENNDKVGCIFFSDRVEKFIPPKKGRSHILMIIRELIEFVPQHRGTALSEPFRYLTNVIRKRCTAFVLSDFIEPDDDKEKFEEALKIASGKHDIVGIRVYDRRDAELPDVGIVEVQDAETGRKVWIDTSLDSLRRRYRDRWERMSGETASVLNRSRVDHVSVVTDEDYVKALIKLFGRR